MARELGVAKATIADAVAALERKGLLAGRANPDDRRGKLLSLTETGRTVAAAVQLEEGRLVEPLNRVDSSRKAQALETLLDLVAGLHTVGVITIDRSCKTCRFFEVGAPTRSHRCALLDASLTPETLRVRCPEHEPV